MCTHDLDPTDPLVELLSDRWWAFVVRGVAALLFGIVTLVMPAASLFALVLLWGAFAIVDGVFAIAAAIRSGRAGERWGWFLIEGVVSIGAGLFTLLFPWITAVVLLAVIAGWAIVSGIAQIGAAIRLRRVIEGEWVLGLSGALSIVFGALLIVWPGQGALAVAWMIGGYAIFFGVLLIATGIELHRVAHPREKAWPSGGAPRPA